MFAFIYQCERYIPKFVADSVKLRLVVSILTRDTEVNEFLEMALTEAEHGNTPFIRSFKTNFHFSSIIQKIAGIQTFDQDYQIISRQQRKDFSWMRPFQKQVSGVLKSFDESKNVWKCLNRRISQRIWTLQLYHNLPERYHSVCGGNGNCVYSFCDSNFAMWLEHNYQPERDFSRSWILWRSFIISFDAKGRRRVIQPTLFVAFSFSIIGSFVKNFYVLSILRFFSGFLYVKTHVNQ